MFGLATFLFDYICCNRIVWGATQYSEVTLRHTASAPDNTSSRWPGARSVCERSASSVVAMIEDARAKRIDNVDEFLAKRFGRKMVDAIKVAHEQDEHRPIETLWDATTAVTAFAREIQHQDRRVDLERQAGQILDLAAA